MKQYKVGDTIYVKGKIVEIDHDDTDLPYCVNVGPINGIWPDRSDIIDELPTAEPVKPVLPKDVAEELVLAKESGDTFYNYITDHVAHPKTYLFMFKCFDNNTRVVALFDAWFNGYTVEKEPRFNVYAPKSWLAGHTFKDYVTAFCKKDSDNITWFQTAKDSLSYDEKYQFTNEEIKKYDLENFHKELVVDD